MSDENSPEVAGQGQTWAARQAGIQVGDRVCYSQRYLQSTGQYTGDAPFARGTVIALKPLGSITLAEIDWKDKNMPECVCISHLSRVTDGGILDR